LLSIFLDASAGAVSVAGAGSDDGCAYTPIFFHVRVGFLTAARFSSISLPLQMTLPREPWGFFC
jgi:hypothetical protein